eukprot:GHVT01048546.1.p1 GENE.GHVT01048546.1~~GHVT01048546.1.p1  ORF type:complete len:154 (-),score=5.87 GHVT01048546.1:33-494(-)
MTGKGLVWAVGRSQAEDSVQPARQPVSQIVLGVGYPWAGTVLSLFVCTVTPLGALPASPSVEMQSRPCSARVGSSPLGQPVTAEIVVVLDPSAFPIDKIKIIQTKLLILSVGKGRGIYHPCAPFYQIENIADRLGVRKYWGIINLFPFGKYFR